MDVDSGTISQAIGQRLILRMLSSISHVRNRGGFCLTRNSIVHKMQPSAMGDISMNFLSKCRRFVRIVLAVGLVGILGVAVFSQFWRITLQQSHFMVAISPQGFAIQGSLAPGDRVVMRSRQFPSSDDIVSNMRHWPTLTIWRPAHPVRSPAGTVMVGLPWWFVVAIWGLSIMVARRMARRRPPKAGFPVELNEPSKGNSGSR